MKTKINSEWHDASQEKPKSSTPMEKHRVIVWRNDNSWCVGWYIGELEEWRIEGSNNNQTDILYWKDIVPPSFEKVCIPNDCGYCESEEYCFTLRIAKGSLKCKEIAKCKEITDETY